MKCAGCEKESSDIYCPECQARPYRAWYSARAARMFGSLIYARANGEEVEITSVDKVQASDPDGAYYNWPDKVCLGEVVKLVRFGYRPYLNLLWGSLQ